MNTTCNQGRREVKLNVGYLEFHVRIGYSDCRIAVHVDEISAICEAPNNDSPYTKARTHLFTNGSKEPYALTDEYKTVVERYMNEKDRLAKSGNEDEDARLEPSRNVAERRNGGPEERDSVLKKLNDMGAWIDNWNGSDTIEWDSIADAIESARKFIENGGAK